MSGGGMTVGSKGGKGGSYFVVGFELKDAVEDWSLAVCPGVWFNGLVSRVLPFSDVYMTATLVEGEFMVPVSDHPIASQVSYSSVEFVDHLP
jgi:hypothetical protein